MGNWQLEVAKFGMYVFAPVMSFWVYHKIDFWKEDLERYERKIHTPAVLQNEKQIKEDLAFLEELKRKSLQRKLEFEASKAQ